MNDLYAIGLLLTLGVLAMTFGVLALYAHTIMPGLKKETDPTFVRAFQAIDRAIINPFFMLQFFLPIFLLGGLLWHAINKETQDITLLGLALVLYIVAVVLTMAVNVPLNDAIKQVDSNADNSALSKARQVFNEHRWTTANVGRTVATLGAAACVFFVLLSQ